jgi:transposase
MANELLSMNKIKKILKLLHEGVSQRQICNLARAHRLTIKKYEAIFTSHPFSYADLLKLSDKELDQIVATPIVEKPVVKALNELFIGMEVELKRKGVTKYFLWERYLKDNPAGVKYSQFCNYFRAYLKSKNISFVFDHKAGDKLMIDFAGKKLAITNPITGALTPVEFFVAVLPASSYTYAQACYSQQSGDFLGAICNCLNFIGGVPQAIVPDNLKPAVTKASKYDPELNQTMADFADHYDTCILPTRAHSPKDKAMVESTVKLLYTRVYAPLYDKVFYSLNELNLAIAELVDKHNEMLMQGRDYSRRHTFESLEKQFLKPLPESAFEIKKYQQAKVHPNCHVLLSEDKHSYSVPHQYVGKAVCFNYNNDTVEIYYKLDRIATHQRLKLAYKYTTNGTHLHPKHQYYSIWSPEFFTKQAANIGENTNILMQAILRQGKHPEQSFKRCQGVLQLAGKYGNDKMEEASAVCVHYELITYQKLAFVLSTDLDLSTLQDKPPVVNMMHENIRGNSYYY